MKRIVRRFSRSAFSIKHLSVDAVLIFIALYLSLWLRLGEARLDEHIADLNKLAGLFVVLRLLCFVGWGVYQSMWRYISVPDAIVVVKAMAFSVPILISATYIFPHLGYLPRSLFIIDFFVGSAALMGARLIRRRLYERQTAATKKQHGLGKMLIYGAGTNGRHLAQRLMTDPNNRIELIGFIDDDPKKQDRIIGGLQVLGVGADLGEIISRTGVTDLVVAVSQPSMELLRELATVGRNYRVRPQVINNLSSETINPKHVQLYRQLELSDLLNRPKAEIDLNSVRSMFEGRTVLVTGAGGSIGSEIARQVSIFSPTMLLLLDHSELNLYEIDRELRPSNERSGNVVPLLVDLRDKGALKRLFAEYKPNIVLHAAAYKHVHLVEANPGPAILNNIQGTLNTLQLAEEFNCERFLLISTDKAVNPAGIMGATKRVCEILTSLWGAHLKRPFSAVRFGNVLGSSGSLIPLLREQIQNGGPLTVTHPDMTRYFMLIPEAVSLVLMSSYLAKAGDISVLRMGEPVKIIDVARSLLALMGKSEEEIPIMFTGVRPGEKMFEELYLRGDELTTPHPDILTVPKGDIRPGMSREKLLVAIDKIIALADSGSPNAVAELKALVASAAEPAALSQQAVDVSAVPHHSR